MAMRLPQGRLWPRAKHQSVRASAAVNGAAKGAAKVVRIARSAVSPSLPRQSRATSVDPRSPPVGKQLSTVFVSSECAPWSKTGGLADVMGSLPKALAALGHRVMVVTPRYLSPETEKRYAAAKDTGVRKGIDLRNGGYHEVGFFHLHEDHVDWVFVDHISYHRPGSPYGNSQGQVYADNLFRFSLLCMAALEATLVLPVGSYRNKGAAGEVYGQNCVFVANDWHAALLPVYMQARFQPFGVHKDSKCVLALHNLAHQGAFPASDFASLGLPGQWYSNLEWVEHAKPPATNSHPKPGPARVTINCLKAGLVSSDAVITVSQTYAAEICNPTGTKGEGLASLLTERATVLRGITNGVDTEEWDPATDKHLTHKFSAQNMQGKLQCKMALQREVGLPVDPHRPLMGFIGRLDYQKGPDLLLDALPHLINLDCQVVILGSGAPDYEARVAQAQKDHPYYVRGVTKFDVPLSHRIMAGCDMLLMPSRFEPCGLNQLYAQLYGTVPIAHSTGGLRDTIDEFNTFAGPDARDRGTGWTFYPATLENFVDAAKAAVEVYREQPQEWSRLQVRCMQRDFSWGRAARQYEKVFQGLMLPQPAKTLIPK